MTKKFKSSKIISDSKYLLPKAQMRRLLNKAVKSVIATSKDKKIIKATIDLAVNFANGKFNQNKWYNLRHWIGIKRVRNSHKVGGTRYEFAGGDFNNFSIKHTKANLSKKTVEKLRLANIITTNQANKLWVAMGQNRKRVKPIKGGGIKKPINLNKDQKNILDIISNGKGITVMMDKYREATVRMLRSVGLEPEDVEELMLAGVL